MNQRQFFQTAKKKKIPASVLKWIWDNKETLLALIALLFPGKKAALAEETEDCPLPKPTYIPPGSSPNGWWVCVNKEWKYIEDLG